MCSNPGVIARASSTISATSPSPASSVVAILVSSEPTHQRKNASPAMSTTISTTVQHDHAS